MEKDSFSYSRRILGLIGSVLLVLGAAAFPRPAAGQSAAGSIQIEPAFQEVLLTDTAATSSAQIKLTNSSDDEQTFELSAVDIQQFDADGNIILADKPLAGTQFALAEFITVPQQLITIPPKQSALVPVEVKNSQSLGAGGHYAAVVARLRSTTNTDQVVLPAVSSFILIRKQGGEHYNLSLIDSSLQSAVWWKSLPDKATLRFSNQGNSHVVPRGTIQISDQFGRLVAKSILNENSLYIFPGTQREVSQSIRSVSRLLPISFLHVQVTGTSQPGGVQFSQSHWIIYTNIGGILISLFALITLILVGKRIITYVRRTKT